MSKIDRSSPFAKSLDSIDQRIATLVVERNNLVGTMPLDYDSDGEGRAYFRELGGLQAENVYHAVSRLSEP